MIELIFGSILVYALIAASINALIKCLNKKSNLTRVRQNANNLLGSWMNLLDSVCVNRNLSKIYNQPFKIKQYILI